MNLVRMFSSERYKGTKGYLRTQKKYEIVRTILYFAISLSLFISGYITTGRRENLLTIVAVLGCLPACKSAVNMIMFLRYKGCSPALEEEFDTASWGMSCLYDCVFTSYSKNYEIAHLVVCGNTICGFSQDAKFDETHFYKHIDSLLKKDNFKDTSIKIFQDKKKYLNRLAQMKELEVNETLTAGILSTLKSISL